jgi:glucan biosynthesis protein C
MQPFRGCISAVDALLPPLVTSSETSNGNHDEMRALEDSSMESRVRERRFDLDWLRVFAFTLLILFHTGMMFVSWDWHVKNAETSRLLEALMRFLHQWRMPLLFFISGAAVWYMLEKYSWPGYLRERFIRLLLPLVFGMLVVIPPQVYFERQFQGWAYASFLEFYPTVFTSGAYPQGNLSWHHLWYIPYILMYSLISLPLLLWLRTASGRAVTVGLRRVLCRPGALLLLCLPCAVSDLCLRPFWPGDANNLIADWANFTSKGLIFLTGFLLCSGEEVWGAVERYRFHGLGLGIITYGLLCLCWYSEWEIQGPAWAAYRVLQSLNTWCWILALLGFGKRHLSFNHPFLKYATEAVYPWYILHQTVIVAIGYFAAGWNMEMWWKYACVACAMLLTTGMLYELLIRRCSILRPLFGLKLRPRPVVNGPMVAKCVPASGR